MNSTLDGLVEATFVSAGKSKKGDSYWLRITDGVEPIFLSLEEHAYNDIKESEYERGNPITLTINYNIFTQRGVVVALGQE